MVAGHLQEKNGFYYAVLSYYDNAGRRRTKWIGSGLTVRGNKRKAENFLAYQRQKFVPDMEPESEKAEEKDLFSSFLLEWVKTIKPTVAASTYSSYELTVTKVIAPYFAKKKTALTELTAADLQTFYEDSLQYVKPITISHYHAMIHKALNYAVKNEMLNRNPADHAEKPKVENYAANFYTVEEMQKLFSVIEGTKLEYPVLLAAFYGLRRSEVMGLKWDAVDFDKDTITICHTVVTCTVDGKSTMVAADKTKTKSSRRTLPLVPEIKAKLEKLKKIQENNRQLCGRSYCKKYLGYICVDDMGYLLSPNYVTDAFRKLLLANGMRQIRFHDLRHSCASLLLANGVQMKQIQEWLGHSNFSTTANIYAHLEYESKKASASAMATLLKIGEN